jgi:hypothetical protein
MAEGVSTHEKASEEEKVQSVRAAVILLLNLLQGKQEGNKIGQCMV